MSILDLYKPKENKDDIQAWLAIANNTLLVWFRVLGKMMERNDGKEERRRIKHFRAESEDRDLLAGHGGRQI
jgi:hypothetical protein